MFRHLRMKNHELTETMTKGSLPALAYKDSNELKWKGTADTVTNSESKGCDLASNCTFNKIYSATK